jgi:phosphotriesterase-related protein
MTIEEMEDFMSREVEDGIEETPVKPGHVKVAVDAIDSELEVKALRAGARVAKRSGLPMCVHQGMELGPEACDRIVEILDEEQVDPSRVVIAHNDKLFVETNLQALITRPEDWTLRLEVARGLMKKGYNISLDCFGQNWDAESLGILHVHDWQRIAGLYALINEGFTSQIVLGTDTFVKLTYRKYGGEGYCRLTSYVVPTLMSVGVEAETIRQLTVDNPARILSV